MKESIPSSKVSSSTFLVLLRILLLIFCSTWPSFLAFGQEYKPCIDDSDCVDKGHTHACFLYMCYPWKEPRPAHPNCFSDRDCFEGHGKCVKHHKWVECLYLLRNPRPSKGSCFYLFWDGTYPSIFRKSKASIGTRTWVKEYVIRLICSSLRSSSLFRKLTNQWVCLRDLKQYLL